MKVFACIRGIVGELHEGAHYHGCRYIDMIDPAWHPPAVDWTPDAPPSEPWSVPLITLRNVDDFEVATPNGWRTRGTVFVYGDVPADLLDTLRPLLS